MATSGSRLNQPPRPARQLNGFIDGLTPSGIVVGWMLDERRPWLPLGVRLRCRGAWVAHGIAHDFRGDVAAQFEGGWCGFRLRTSCPIEALHANPLYLVDESGEVISRADKLISLPEGIQELDTIEAVTSSDPTVISSVEQLRCCETLFARYVRAHGVDAFIRAAYVYMLARPADEDGLRVYGSRLRRGTHHPFELLQILGASEEHLKRRPELAAPTEPSFPFLVDRDD